MLKKLLKTLNAHEQGDAIVHNVIVIVGENNCFVLGKIHGVFIHNAANNSFITELIEDDDYWWVAGKFECGDSTWHSIWLKDKIKVLEACHKILYKDYTKLNKIDGFKIRTL